MPNREQRYPQLLRCLLPLRGRRQSAATILAVAEVSEEVDLDEAEAVEDRDDLLVRQKDEAQGAHQTPNGKAHQLVGLPRFVVVLGDLQASERRCPHR